MNIKFSWIRNGVDKRPCCEASIEDDEEATYLSCLLSDDGGLGIQYNIDWANEVLHEINLIKENKKNYFDISKECWGVELTESFAKIYFNYDEDYFIKVDIDKIETVINEWKNYLIKGLE